MKDRNVNSYDLKEAQRNLTVLIPSAGTTSRRKTGTASMPGYLRLSDQSSTPRISRAIAPMAEASEDGGVAADALKPQNFTGWETCIAWCMSLLRAEAAFVVDSQGFIIASRGRVPAHGFEGTGAELVYSVEQLERIEPEAGKLAWIDLEFNKRRVVAFVTPSETTEYFVVGLISPDPAYYSAKQAVTLQIVENLPNLE